MTKLILTDYPYYCDVFMQLKKNIAFLKGVGEVADTAVNQYFLNRQAYPGLKFNINKMFSKKERVYFTRHPNLRIDMNDIMKYFTDQPRLMKNGITLSFMLKGYKYDDNEISEYIDHAQQILQKTQYLHQTLIVFERLFRTFNEFIDHLNIDVIDTIPVSNNTFTTVIKARLPKPRQKLLTSVERFMDCTNESLDSPIIFSNINNPDKICEFRLSEVSAEEEANYEPPYVFSPIGLFFGIYKDYEVIDEVELDNIYG